MNTRKVFLLGLLIIGIILLTLNIVDIDFNNMERENYLSLTSNITIIISAIIGFFVKFEWK